MSTILVVQARLSSTRLPGKVLLPILGKPMILFLLERLRSCRTVDHLVLATSDHASDDLLAQIVADAGFEVFRGDLDDVLERYRSCVAFYHSNVVVRITADCPLSDPTLIDEMVTYFSGSDLAYLSNSADPENLTVPDGFDIEVFTASALEQASAAALTRHEREHVTPWFRSPDSLQHWLHYNHQPPRQFYRVTVDDAEDFKLVSAVINSLYPSNPSFGIDDVIYFLNSNQHLVTRNPTYLRNRGSLLSSNSFNPLSSITDENIPTGQDLWNRSKQLIPGGNMLLSKRAENFLPGTWPAYFSKANGCSVYDLNGVCYSDFSTMGVGTNLLGYGHPEVDEAVVNTIRAGNMSTLNCPEEVYLAERLVELHPWSDMVRLARTGGEANAIGIRIARAATGRDVVAVCGYHGWHDWYLASNLHNPAGLSDHLLPGLEPKGVPSGLEGTVKPFSYNRLDQLDNIIATNNLAAVKMEVQRSLPPEPGFLEGVRDLCTRHGIVLIFDECTSGFRETFGGLHLKYGVNPDIAIFGKALGNGYAITAAIGRQSVMEAAQTSFISSTFWTERIGPTAALKTLDIMERERSWDRVSAIGLKLRTLWQDLADSHGLSIQHTGLPALAGFSFQSNNSLSYKTLITQEMLKKGFLASTSFYASIAHTPPLIDAYSNALDSVFSMISRCESGHSVSELLDGPICHSGFQRLN